MEARPVHSAGEWAAAEVVWAAVEVVGAVAGLVVRPVHSPDQGPAAEVVEGAAEVVELVANNVGAVSERHQPRFSLWTSSCADSSR